MKVELEFLDQTKTRLNEKDIEYDSAVPVPNVGEKVSFGDRVHEVTKRDFIYLLDSGEDFPDLKISLWVK